MTGCKPWRPETVTNGDGTAHWTSWSGVSHWRPRVTPRIPTITTLAWVPEFARGFVRDLRPRWAFEEVGQPYGVILITDAKCATHRRLQPFGQVPTYRDDEVSIFESGAIVLRIAERAGKLIPKDAALRMQALQGVTAALNSVEPFVMTLAVNDIFEADRDWSKARHAKVVEDLHVRLHDLQ